jgi:hypothetical protein
VTHKSVGPASISPHGTLHLMDGAESRHSYLVIARRGSILLGIKFSDLIDGERLGVPGTTYVHARLRSARDPALAAQLDAGMSNVLSLSDQQLGLDAAWPALPFEKVDHGRASLAIGAFIRGSLIADTAAVIMQIGKADIFRQLIDYLIEHAGPGLCLVNAEAASNWLLRQARPTLVKLGRTAALQEVVKATQNEFKAVVADELETVGPHLGQLAAIHAKHAQAWASKLGKDQD